MMSKIVGFVLSQNQSTYIPLINPSLTRTTISGKWGFLTLYKTGDQVEPMAPNVWSMGFPAHQSLLDHNLLLTIGEDEILIENDWLGGIPVYYNSREKIVSTFPEECLTKNPELSEEGLYLFLKYGFSALGTTPFKDMSTLRYFSLLRYRPTAITIEEKTDPVFSVDLSTPASEEEIWALLKGKISHVLDATTGPVISPLSGGLDSRIINTLVPNAHKSRIRTYSYGGSNNQENCFESQIARRVAQKLNLKWKHIHLDEAFNYVEAWHDMFGSGIHLHGMIHIEFYKKILADLYPEKPAFMFSGISGSPFQGEFPPREHIQSPAGLYNLALTHQIDCRAFIGQRDTHAEARFFEQNRQLLADFKWYPVLMIRMKMNLLHYLHKVPAIMGIPSTPAFHNFGIATKMLSLPPERRSGRAWVNEYFQNHDLLFTNRSKYGDTRNTLNRQVFSNHPFEPLDKKVIVQPFIDSPQIDKINHQLGRFNTPLERLRFFLTTQRVIKEVLKKIGIHNTFLKNLSPYLILKAVEKTLKKHS
jgi:hypothetical protein